MKTVTGSGTVFADMEGDGFSFASVVRLEDDYGPNGCTCR